MNIETPAARRSPRQQRSRAKVEVILGAVEKIAAEDIGAMTTSSIAKRAGISVGSLYQTLKTATTSWNVCSNDIVVISKS